MGDRARDSYSRVDYRRLIAWPERIEREWPFLERALGSGPARRLLDLGSGTGEHARFLAAHGFEVLGIDASESMLAKATEEPLPENLRFVRGDLAEVEALAPGDFGGALCLGNTLPHLLDDDHLLRAFRAARRKLLPGAPLVVQIVNYDRVFASRQRHLPLNFRPGDAPGEEIVFLRLMDPRPDGTVIFNPTTLLYRPGQEPPVEIVSTKNVRLRGWKREEVERLLGQAGFTRRDLYGGMRQEPYEAATSPDLVVVAR